VDIGLHFLKNAIFYKDLLIEKMVIGDDAQFSEFVKVLFKNKADQDPYHDLATAFILNRPIVVWYPEVHKNYKRLPKIFKKKIKNKK